MAAGQSCARDVHDGEPHVSVAAARDARGVLERKHGFVGLAGREPRRAELRVRGLVGAHDLIRERLLEHLGALLRQASVDQQIGEPAEIGIVASTARPCARAASSRARGPSRRFSRTRPTARASRSCCPALSRRAARATGSPRGGSRLRFSKSTTSSSQLAGASGASVAARSAARPRFRVVAELVVREAEQIERLGHRLGLVRDEPVEHLDGAARSPRLR